MIVTLIRFPTIAPLGDVYTEPTPPIGIAYLASAIKGNGIKVQGIDASGRNLNKIFKIPEYNLRGKGIELNEVIDLINPKTEIIGISTIFKFEIFLERDFNIGWNQIKFFYVEKKWEKKTI